MKRSVSLAKAKVKASKAPDAVDLLVWYDRHRRILPWRALPGAKADPYHVWLSEIMLQQTTVAAVSPYFQKFLKRWPTITQLAKAKRDHVLQMWAGLGYYRRAHLLHDCAKTICTEHDAHFPETEAELMQLPGFGPYTAAAVASIAFNQCANVVDGNVERVIARIFAIETPMPKAKQKLRQQAATLLPKARFGDYAQALMDLGATICTPRNPKCGLCPWNDKCIAHARGIEEKLPRREKAKTKPVRRTVAFVLANNKNEILIRQRPQDGLLGGMMEVPSSPWNETDKLSLNQALKFAPAAISWTLLPGKVKHVFSHFELDIRVALGFAKGKVKGKWVRIEALDSEALPSVMRKIVRHAIKDI